MAILDLQLAATERTFLGGCFVFYFFFLDSCTSSFSCTIHQLRTQGRELICVMFFRFRLSNSVVFSIDPTCGYPKKHNARVQHLAEGTLSVPFSKRPELDSVKFWRGATPPFGYLHTLGTPHVSPGHENLKHCALSQLRSAKHNIPRQNPNLNTAHQAVVQEQGRGAATWGQPQPCGAGQSFRQQNKARICDLRGSPRRLEGKIEDEVEVSGCVHIPRNASTTRVVSASKHKWRLLGRKRALPGSFDCRQTLSRYLSSLLSKASPETPSLKTLL